MPLFLKAIKAKKQKIPARFAQLANTKTRRLLVSGELSDQQRKEIKKGKGHKGFSFKFSPDVTLQEDLFRRDLTINAMAMDQETQEIFLFAILF